MKHCWHLTLPSILVKWNTAGTCISDGQWQNGFAVRVAEVNKHSFLMSHLGSYVHTGTSLTVDGVVVSTVQHQLHNAWYVIVFSRQMKRSCLSHVWVDWNTSSLDNNNNIIISKTMLMVLSSWQSHCEFTRFIWWMLNGAKRPKTKPDDLGCESACTGCQNLHPPSAFIIITQLESWYSVYRPTAGRRMSQSSTSHDACGFASSPSPWPRTPLGYFHPPTISLDPTRPSPCSRSYYSFPVLLRVGGWVGQSTQ